MRRARFGEDSTDVVVAAGTGSGSVAGSGFGVVSGIGTGSGASSRSTICAVTSSVSVKGTTSCLEVSECRLSLSATVVGGVELDDATLDIVSVTLPAALDSGSRKSGSMVADTLWKGEGDVGVMCECMGGRARGGHGRDKERNQRENHDNTPRRIEHVESRKNKKRPTMSIAPSGRCT